MATWRPAETQYGDVITRRLSPTSFTTSDPVTCANWLRSVGYHDVPRRSRGEVARLQLEAGTVIIFDSGLVIAMAGGAR